MDTEVVIKAELTARQSSPRRAAQKRRAAPPVDDVRRSVILTVNILYLEHFYAFA